MIAALLERRANRFNRFRNRCRMGADRVAKSMFPRAPRKGRHMTEVPRYHRVADIVSADMDGERVMMSLEKGAYFGLAGIGGAIWDLLSEPRSAEEIVGQVMQTHEVDARACRADVEAFLADLERNGLVRRL